MRALDSVFVILSDLAYKNSGGKILKICVLFPGVGYHCDKPLLYYSGKLAAQDGYEVVKLNFSGFQKGIRGSSEKVGSAADAALSMVEKQLAETDFSVYDEAVFIGKSIGTVACLAYRQKYGIKAKCILLTPLEQTFEYDAADSTAFHGTSDPWADTELIERLCRENDVPLHEYDRANHSLETGDTSCDLKNIVDVMEKLKKLI